MKFLKDHALNGGRLKIPRFQGGRKLELGWFQKKCLLITLCCNLLIKCLMAKGGKLNLISIDQITLEQMVVMVQNGATPKTL
jgi:hypothetical protein